MHNDLILFIILVLFQKIEQLFKYKIEIINLSQQLTSFKLQGKSFSYTLGVNIVEISFYNNLEQNTYRKSSNKRLGRLFYFSDLKGGVY